MSKKYILKLDEVDILYLYEKLKQVKPRMYSIEQSLKEIIDKNPAFRVWDERIKNIENEVHC